MNSIGRGRVGRFAISATAACLLLTGLAIGASSSAGASSKYKKTLACEVTDTGGINDRSFNASAYLGLKEAVAVAPSQIKKEVQSTPSTGTESTYETEIGSFVSQHCSIIITVGFLMSDATWNAAQQNKSDHFAQVDNGNSSPGKDGVAVKPYTGTASNILGLTYETQQDAINEVIRNGSPHGAKVVEIYLATFRPQVEKNERDLANGAITWGTYNKRRLEIVHAHTVAAQFGD